MILPRSFYTRDTLQVARDLLGKYLVYKDKSAKIIEVEAYIGQDDKACHAACGKTKRNEVMFKKGGFAYIYLIYGMYNCLNISTENEGFPAAVLIRALDLPGADGPGKLCRLFGLTRVQNGLDVTHPPLYIEDRPARHASPARNAFVADGQGDAGGEDIVEKILKTPRIGVDYAGKDAQLPWRFLIK